MTIDHIVPLDQNGKNCINNLQSTCYKCQPNSIMEVIPNTWDNAERLCKIFDCSEEDLPKKVPMETKPE